MARTIAEIQAQMDQEQALQTSLSGLNSPSQASIYTLWKYVMSASIWAFEKLLDIFKVELETIATNAQIGTVLWVKDMILKFQYSATLPQIVQLINFVPGYDPVDETLKIITRASVKTLPTKVVAVKVAKSEPPTALSTPELNSLIGYLDEVSFAGVQYQVTSTLPDELFLEVEIFYNGQYAAIISTTVIDAIEAYLAAIPFDGIIKVSSLEDAIQAVPGVSDLVINNLSMRANGVPFGSGVYLVQNKTTINKSYPTNSGYVISETTAGETLSDKLTFTPQ